MSNKLVEIQTKNWLQLRNLYAPNGPHTFLGYNLVDNYVRWLEKDSNLKNIIFYSLNGDWSDGTFIVIERHQIHVNTLNESTDRLFQLLQLVDFRMKLQFAVIPEKFRSVILETIKVRNIKIEYDSKLLMYYMPYAQALKLDVKVPDGITLAPLNDSHCEIVDIVWPHRTTGSLFYMQQMAKLNPNIGAFTSDGKLVAWVLRMQAGPLLALQVDKDYYNRGYGMLVSKVVMKEIAELKQDCAACVFEENKPSRALFERLGCEVIDNVHWIGTLPEDENFECIQG